MCIIRCLPSYYCPSQVSTKTCSTSGLYIQQCSLVQLYVHLTEVNKPDIDSILVLYFLAGAYNGRKTSAAGLSLAFHVKAIAI